MKAFNVVHMRVKADREQDFLRMNQRPGHEVRTGLYRAVMIKTGERSYCFIGEWENFAAIAAARPDMLDDLAHLRDMLEDLGQGTGVTYAVSGEVVTEGP